MLLEQAGTFCMQNNDKLAAYIEQTKNLSESYKVPAAFLFYLNFNLDIC